MRLRFAPSPTGALHIGGARTALYNWLLARQSGGTLVLRLEDTDRERSSEADVVHILDALGWLGLDWDEGPLRQSERAERHRELVELLVREGKAYRSRATAQDVQRYKRRYGPARGFRGSEEGEGAVRLRVGDEGETVVEDLIRGATRFVHRHLDDPVIARADGTVLYNFAVAVDDLDQGITHVVRGEDHLSNTPKQLLVIEALRAVGVGADRPLPAYAHLPLLHGPDGKKLAKRHGATSVQELRSAGYLPEAVVNYLALLGWGSADDRTVLTREELVERFSLDRVSRNPARFDEAKLRWLNGIYLRGLSPEELARRLEDYLQLTAPEAAKLVAGRRELLVQAATISQEKIQNLHEFWKLAGFLFAAQPLDPKAEQRYLEGHGRKLLAAVEQALAPLEPFSEERIAATLQAVAARERVKPGDLYQPIRVAVSGSTVSPGIFESLAALGKDEVLARIRRVLARRTPAGVDR